LSLSFGSKVLGPETDIIYNDEMDDFSTPNTINSFGVPASPANYIAPGKRPVSSMAPLIIMEKQNQRVQQVLGASGGTRITTSIAQVAMLNLWFNEDIKTAIDSPRLHSQLLPQEVIAELGFDYVKRFLRDYWKIFDFLLGYIKTIERTWS
jgi:gamma-glutamyltranspeptidase/glutathione hydrolase/leukotriene-C4 hydrolase